MIHAAPGLFLSYEPKIEAVPLLVDVSRSGREYPKEYRSPRETFKAMEEMPCTCH
jgi:hypothetical protein